MLDTTLAVKLQEPFDPEDIKWRPQRTGITNGYAWMVVQPYITSRAIQTRLDDVFGVAGWEVTFEETKAGDGFLCTVSIWDNGRWIRKQDLSQKTNVKGIDPLKGGASNALKRAGVMLGIGRYLYRLEQAYANVVRCEKRRDAVYNFAKITQKSNNPGQPDEWQNVDWEAPALPDWALPGLDSTKFSAAILEATNVIKANKAFSEAYHWANSFSRSDLVQQFRDELQQTIQKLDNEAKDNIATRVKEVTEWLDGEIISISLVGDTGTIHSIGDRIGERLAKKCQGQYFKSEPLFNLLKKAISDRVNEIEGN